MQRGERQEDQPEQAARSGSPPKTAETAFGRAIQYDRERAAGETGPQGPRTGT